MKKILASLFIIFTTISCGWNSTQNNSGNSVTYKECPDCDGEGYVQYRCNNCYGSGVNGNQKCSDFGNSECSIFGIKTTVLFASAVQ